MKLKEFLNERKMSQAEFAREVEEKPMNISRWIKGAKPSQEAMQKIVAYTKGEVTANDFYDVEVKNDE